MVDITDEEFRKFGTRTARPIPGQSLTSNPETSQPWETPPEFTTKDEALTHFLTLFQDEERYQAIIESLEEGVSVMDLVAMFLTQSFQEGEINPDLMLMLAEPLAFILMAFGERAGIEVTIVDDPDDPESDDEDAEFNKFRELMENITEPKDDDEDFPIEEKLDEMELPSLMAKGEQ